MSNKYFGVSTSRKANLSLFRRINFIKTIDMEIFFVLIVSLNEIVCANFYQRHEFNNLFLHFSVIFFSHRHTGCNIPSGKLNANILVNVDTCWHTLRCCDCKNSHDFKHDWVLDPPLHTARNKRAAGWSGGGGGGWWHVTQFCSNARNNWDGGSCATPQHFP